MEEEEIAYEAAWVITNLSSGTNLHCQSVLATKCHTTLVKLLDREKGKDTEQVIVCVTVGNVCIGEYCRNRYRGKRYGVRMRDSEQDTKNPITTNNERYNA